MIKRLKWNVLYGGGGGEESDGGLSSSDDSEAGDAGAASNLLAQLIARDPDMKHARLPVNWSDPESDSYGDEDDGSLNDSNGTVGDDGSHEQAVENDDAMTGQDGELDHVDEFDQLCGMSDDDEGDDESEDVQGRASWRECNLCPGKHFLNDREVHDHLNSKGHARALKAYERRKVKSATGIDDDGRVRRVSDNEKDRTSRQNGKATRDKGNCRKDPDAPVEKVGDKPMRSLIDEDSNETKTSADAEKLLQRDLKRKAAVKLKLRRLRCRKWEREQAMACLSPTTSRAGNRETKSASISSLTVSNDDNKSAFKKRKMPKTSKLDQPEADATLIKDPSNTDGGPSKKHTTSKLKNLALTSSKPWPMVDGSRIPMKSLKTVKLDNSSPDNESTTLIEDGYPVPVRRRRNSKPHKSLLYDAVTTVVEGEQQPKVKKRKRP